jgi:hypothetical protein
MNERTNQLVIACVTLVIVLILLFLNNAIQGRLKYMSYLAAQANVLACRVDNTAAADRICGSVPTLDSFR